MAQGVAFVSWTEGEEEEGKLRMSQFAVKISNAPRM